VQAVDQDVLCRAVLWCAVLCCAVLCRAVLCRAVPCCAVLCCAASRVLLGREILSVTRNPADIAGRCLIFTWLAIFVGLIFYNLPTSLDSTRSRLNVLFVAPVILLLMPFVYMSLFTADKQYFIQGWCGWMLLESLLLATFVQISS